MLGIVHIATAMRSSIKHNNTATSIGQKSGEYVTGQSGADDDIVIGLMWILRSSRLQTVRNSVVARLFQTGIGSECLAS
jgi:hypothetical protein